MEAHLSFPPSKDIARRCGPWTRRALSRHSITLDFPVRKISAEPGMGAQILIPSLRRQKQEDFCEYKAKLVYVSSGAARTAWRDPLPFSPTNLLLFVCVLLQWPQWCTFPTVNPGHTALGHTLGALGVED